MGKLATKYVSKADHHYRALTTSNQNIEYCNIATIINEQINEEPNRPKNENDQMNNQSNPSILEHTHRVRAKTHHDIWSFHTRLCVFSLKLSCLYWWEFTSKGSTDVHSPLDMSIKTLNIYQENGRICITKIDNDILYTDTDYMFNVKCECT